MKVALCFIISYKHILNKEHIWREWIEQNKDIINVYFYYKDLKQIQSKWILEHAIPSNYIYETSYYHVIPAYLSVMNYALKNDGNNKWFCLLTDSCCPIISPKRFRYLFFKHYKSSIFSWRRAWWNTTVHKRGNLAKLPKELWLAHDPWFVLTKENLFQVMQFVNTRQDITKIICDGGLANETLFAVIFYLYKEIEHHDDGDNNNNKNKNNKSHIICSISHLTDWSRMSSSTSPHVFKDANHQDITFINTELERNKCAMFIRKIDPLFPDDTLNHEIVIIQPFEFIYNKYLSYVEYGFYSMIIFYIMYYWYNKYNK